LPCGVDSVREPAGVPPREHAMTIALPVSGQVVVRLFPHDPRFARDVRRAALAVRMSAGTEKELRDLLERALRAWYPHVEVRIREDLAGLLQEDRVWYVMRDGQVGNQRELTDRLYAALSDARATTAESDLAVQRAEAALAVARQPRSRRRRATARAAGGPDPRDGA
jgi:hypothetical protein